MRERTPGNLSHSTAATEMGSTDDPNRSTRTVARVVDAIGPNRRNGEG